MTDPTEASIHEPAPHLAPARAPRNLVVDATFIAGATGESSLPPPVVPEIAFAGRSNVGKSSLLNAVMQRKSLARTSSTPGCTRQINVFDLTLDDGLALHFVDLPGYGYAKVSKKEKAEWGPMLEGYLERRSTLRALVVLVDVRRGVEDDDRQLIEFMQSPSAVARNKPVDVLLVATKLDKLPLSQRKPALAGLAKNAGVRAIGFSAVTGDGRDLLWGRIRAAL